MDNVTADILAICGSTRVGGNTDQILQYAKEVALQKNANLSVLNLRDFNISACGQCGDCNYRENPCDFHDDMLKITERMSKADGIIYAVPVHGFGMGHLMQIFIERAGVCYLRFDRPLTNKVGGAIVTGRRYNHQHVYSQLVSNILLNRMIMVGSGFPALLHAGKTNEAFDDLEGMDSVRRMVERMVDMVSVMKRYSRMTNDTFLTYNEANERMISENTLMRLKESLI